MGKIFHFRGEETTLVGYLKDIYLILMLLFVLTGASMLIKGYEEPVVGAYTFLFFIGIPAIYWTPKVQEVLDFQNRGLNYLLYISQLIPVIGNVAFFSLLAVKWFEREPVYSIDLNWLKFEFGVDEGRETLEVDTDQDSDKELDLDTLQREDFNGFRGFPKDSLLYQTSWIRLFLILATFGLRALRAERWSEEEVDELVQNADETLSEQGLEGKEYHICSGTESNLLAISDEYHLLLLEIDPEEKDILPHKKINYHRVKDEEKHHSYVIYDREDEDKIEKLVFQTEKRKNSFIDDLGENLNEYGLYRYRQVWEDKETIEEIRRADTGLQNNFQHLSPFEFEEFVADLFNEMGYNARATSKSADYGVDVIAENGAERVAIQVKRHQPSNKVGAPTVQKTLGSRYKADADMTVIVTTSHFTGPAFEQARDAPIELWDKEKLHREVERHFIQID